ncbi:hypothetical protein J6590_085254 [Homalodisca vitripennis]|nr:hypothetical protein J6590_085254 [Homalodisca vitripennis]
MQLEISPSPSQPYYAACHCVYSPDVTAEVGSSQLESSRNGIDGLIVERALVEETLMTLWVSGAWSTFCRHLRERELDEELMSEEVILMSGAPSGRRDSGDLVERELDEELMCGEVILMSGVPSGRRDSDDDLTSSREREELMSREVILMSGVRSGRRDSDDLTSSREREELMSREVILTSGVRSGRRDSDDLVG